MIKQTARKIRNCLDRAFIDSGSPAILTDTYYFKDKEEYQIYIKNVLMEIGKVINLFEIYLDKYRPL